MNKTPTTLIIMDGFGLSDEVKGNAVRGANTPVLDRLNGEYAHTQLSASGLDVGLPAGQMGNSEVGHTNIGGGRVVFQDLPRISRAIEDGTFFENPAYNAAMDACLEKGTALHLYGLLSNGGVHSTVEHVWALLKMAGIKGLKRVYLHCFLDGRDVSPTSGADFVAEAQKKCAELGVGKIATVMGRYYAMDRDKRWDRLERAYDAMAQRVNQTSVESANTQTNVAVIKRASAPTTASFPRLGLNLAASLLAGLILAVGTALVRELFDRRMRNAEDVIVELKQPLLVTLPISSAGRPQSTASCGPCNPVSQLSAELRTFSQAACASALGCP